MNQVELFFSILQRKVIRNGNFTSRDDLITKMLTYIAEYDETDTPFKWTYAADPSSRNPCVTNFWAAALVMHGEKDDSVPVSDARQLFNAHGGAELSLFEGAGHCPRHGPRAVAVLLGWPDRMRSTHVHPAAERV